MLIELLEVLRFVRGGVGLEQHQVCTAALSGLRFSGLLSSLRGRRGCSSEHRRPHPLAFLMLRLPRGAVPDRGLFIQQPALPFPTTTESLRLEKTS